MTQAAVKQKRRVGWAAFPTTEARLGAIRQLPVERRAAAMRGLSDDARADLWRALTEGERREILLAHGTPPEACGPDMPVAPARGPVIAAQPVVVILDPDGNERAVELGYRGRAFARAEDVFDRMLRAQTDAHREAHGWLFDPGQVAIARIYAALVEEVSRGDMRGSNLEASTGGAGGDDGFRAHFSDISAQVAAMRRRVGPDDAMPVRRVRPSRRGRRVAISRLDLVDRVCLGQMTLSEVLRGAGWPVNGAHRHALRCELQGCLDRMQGYPATSRSRHKM